MNICFLFIVLCFALEAIAEALKNKLKNNKYEIVSVVLVFICKVYILYRAVKIGF